MAKISVILNSKSVQALLKSPEIASVCETEAKQLTRASGMKYIPDVYVGKTRVNAMARVKGASDD